MPGLETFFAAWVAINQNRLLRDLNEKTCTFLNEKSTLNIADSMPSTEELKNSYAESYIVLKLKEDKPELYLINDEGNPQRITIVGVEDRFCEAIRREIKPEDLEVLEEKSTVIPLKGMGGVIWNMVKEYGLVTQLPRAEVNKRINEYMARLNHYGKDPYPFDIGHVLDSGEMAQGRYKLNPDAPSNLYATLVNRLHQSGQIELDDVQHKVPLNETDAIFCNNKGGLRLAYVEENVKDLSTNQNQKIRRSFLSYCLEKMSAGDTDILSKLTEEESKKFTEAMEEYIIEKAERLGENPTQLEEFASGIKKFIANNEIQAKFKSVDEPWHAQYLGRVIKMFPDENFDQVLRSSIGGDEYNKLSLKGPARLIEYLFKNNKLEAGLQEYKNWPASTRLEVLKQISQAKEGSLVWALANVLFLENDPGGLKAFSEGIDSTELNKVSANLWKPKEIKEEEPSADKFSLNLRFDVSELINFSPPEVLNEIIQSDITKPSLFTRILAEQWEQWVKFPRLMTAFLKKLNFETINQSLFLEDGVTVKPEFRELLKKIESKSQQVQLINKLISIFPSEKRVPDLFSRLAPQLAFDRIVGDLKVGVLFNKLNYTGCEINVLEELPSREELKQAYTEKYVLVKSPHTDIQLYLIDFEGNPQEVPIKHKEIFMEEINDNWTKFTLLIDETKNLLTDNGGHVPKVPKSEANQLIAEFMDRINRCGQDTLPFGVEDIFNAEELANGRYKFNINYKANLAATLSARLSQSGSHKLEAIMDKIPITDDAALFINQYGSFSAAYVEETVKRDPPSECSKLRRSFFEYSLEKMASGDTDIIAKLPPDQERYFIHELQYYAEQGVEGLRNNNIRLDEFASTMEKILGNNEIRKFCQAAIEIDFYTPSLIAIFPPRHFGSLVKALIGKAEFAQYSCTGVAALVEYMQKTKVLNLPVTEGLLEERISWETKNEMLKELSEINNDSGIQLAKQVFFDRNVYNMFARHLPESEATKLIMTLWRPRVSQEQEPKVKKLSIDLRFDVDQLLEITPRESLNEMLKSDLGSHSLLTRIIAHLWEKGQESFVDSMSGLMAKLDFEVIKKSLFLEDGISLQPGFSELLKEIESTPIKINLIVKLVGQFPVEERGPDLLMRIAQTAGVPLEGLQTLARDPALSEKFFTVVEYKDKPEDLIDFPLPPNANDLQAFLTSEKGAAFRRGVKGLLKELKTWIKNNESAANIEIIDKQFIPHYVDYDGKDLGMNGIMLPLLQEGIPLLKKIVNLLAEHPIEIHRQGRLTPRTMNYNKLYLRLENDELVYSVKKQKIGVKHNKISRSELGDELYDKIVNIIKDKNLDLEEEHLRALYKITEKQGYVPPADERRHEKQKDTIANLVNSLYVCAPGCHTNLNDAYLSLSTDLNLEFMDYRKNIAQQTTIEAIEPYTKELNEITGLPLIDPGNPIHYSNAILNKHKGAIGIQVINDTFGHVCSPRMFERVEEDILRNLKKTQPEQAVENYLTLMGRGNQAYDLDLITSRLLESQYSFDKVLEFALNRCDLNYLQRQLNSKACPIKVFTEMPPDIERYKGKYILLHAKEANPELYLINYESKPKAEKVQINDLELFRAGIEKHLEKNPNQIRLNETEVEKLLINNGGHVPQASRAVRNDNIAEFIDGMDHFGQDTVPCGIGEFFVAEELYQDRYVLNPEAVYNLRVTLAQRINQSGFFQLDKVMRKSELSETEKLIILDNKSIVNAYIEETISGSLNRTPLIPYCLEKMSEDEDTHILANLNQKERDEFLPEFMKYLGVKAKSASTDEDESDELVAVVAQLFKNKEIISLISSASFTSENILNLILNFSERCYENLLRAVVGEDVVDKFTLKGPASLYEFVGLLPKKYEFWGLVLEKLSPSARLKMLEQISKVENLTESKFVKSIFPRTVTYRIATRDFEPEQVDKVVLTLWGRFIDQESHPRPPELTLDIAYLKRLIDISSPGVLNSIVINRFFNPDSGYTAKPEFLTLLNQISDRTERLQIIVQMALSFPPGQRSPSLYENLLRSAGISDFDYKEDLNSVGHIKSYLQLFDPKARYPILHELLDKITEIDEALAIGAVLDVSHLQKFFEDLQERGFYESAEKSYSDAGEQLEAHVRDQVRIALKNRHAEVPAAIRLYLGLAKRYREEEPSWFQLVSGLESDLQTVYALCAVRKISYRDLPVEEGELILESSLEYINAIFKKATQESLNQFVAVLADDHSLIRRLGPENFKLLLSKASKEAVDEFMKKFPARDDLQEKTEKMQKTCSDLFETLLQDPSNPFGNDAYVRVLEGYWDDATLTQKWLSVLNDPRVYKDNSRAFRVLNTIPDSVAKLGLIKHFEKNLHLLSMMVEWPEKNFQKLLEKLSQNEVNQLLQNRMNYFPKHVFDIHISSYSKVSFYSKDAGEFTYAKNFRPFLGKVSQSVIDDLVKTVLKEFNPTPARHLAVNKFLVQELVLKASKEGNDAVLTPGLLTYLAGTDFSEEEFESLLERFNADAVQKAIRDIFPAHLDSITDLSVLGRLLSKGRPEDTLRIVFSKAEDSNLNPIIKLFNRSQSAASVFDFEAVMGVLSKINAAIIRPAIVQALVDVNIVQFGMRKMLLHHASSEAIEEALQQDPTLIFDLGEVLKEAVNEGTFPQWLSKLDSTVFDYFETATILDLLREEKFTPEFLSSLFEKSPFQLLSVAEEMEKHDTYPVTQDEDVVSALKMYASFMTDPSNSVRNHPKEFLEFLQKSISANRGFIHKPEKWLDILQKALEVCEANSPQKDELNLLLARVHQAIAAINPAHDLKEAFEAVYSIVDPSRLSSQDCVWLSNFILTDASSTTRETKSLQFLYAAAEKGEPETIEMLNKRIKSEDDDIDIIKYQETQEKAEIDQGRDELQASLKEFCNVVLPPIARSAQFKFFAQKGADSKHALRPQIFKLEEACNKKNWVEASVCLYELIVNPAVKANPKIKAPFDALHVAVLKQRNLERPNLTKETDVDKDLLNPQFLKAEAAIDFYIRNNAAAPGGHSNAYAEVFLDLLLAAKSNLEKKAVIYALIINKDGADSAPLRKAVCTGMGYRSEDTAKYQFEKAVGEDLENNGMQLKDLREAFIDPLLAQIKENTQDLLPACLEIENKLHHRITAAPVAGAEVNKPEGPMGS